jgi:hypothetical protein
MLLSYSYDQISCNQLLKRHLTAYTIIDSEFEEKITANSIWTAIIETYEKRQLPVVSNLILLFLCINKKRSGYTKLTTIEFIHYGNQYSDRFKQYEEEFSSTIQKYLPLM